MSGIKQCGGGDDLYKFYELFDQEKKETIVNQIEKLIESPKDLSEAKERALALPFEIFQEIIASYYPFLEQLKSLAKLKLLSKLYKEKVEDVQKEIAEKLSHYGNFIELCTEEILKVAFFSGRFLEKLDLTHRVRMNLDRLDLLAKYCYELKYLVLDLLPENYSEFTGFFSKIKYRNIGFIEKINKFSKLENLNINNFNYKAKNSILDDSGIKNKNLIFNTRNYNKYNINDKSFVSEKKELDIITIKNEVTLKKMNSGNNVGIYSNLTYLYVNEYMLNMLVNSDFFKYIKKLTLIIDSKSSLEQTTGNTLLTKIAEHNPNIKEIAITTFPAGHSEQAIVLLKTIFKNLSDEPKLLEKIEKIVCEYFDSYENALEINTLVEKLSEKRKRLCFYVANVNFDIIEKLNLCEKLIFKDTVQTYFVDWPIKNYKPNFKIDPLSNDWVFYVGNYNDNHPTNWSYIYNKKFEDKIEFKFFENIKKLDLIFGSLFLENQGFYKTENLEERAEAIKDFAETVLKQIDRKNKKLEELEISTIETTEQTALALHSAIMSSLMPCNVLKILKKTSDFKLKLPALKTLTLKFKVKNLNKEKYVMECFESQAKSVSAFRKNFIINILGSDLNNQHVSYYEGSYEDHYKGSILGINPHI